MQRTTKKGRSGFNKHLNIRKLANKELKIQIDKKEYPLCCFCGQPITKHSIDNPDSLSIEFNINGKCFADCYRDGELKGTKKYLLRYCFPSHIKCNRYDNFIRQKESLKDRENETT